MIDVEGRAFEACNYRMVFVRGLRMKKVRLNSYGLGNGNCDIPYALLNQERKMQ